MKLVQNAKIVSAAVPVDINNLAVNGDYVSMKYYEHLSIILHFGAVGTGTAITLTQAKEVAGTNTASLGYTKIWTNVGLTTDTLTEVAVTGDSYTVADTANNLYVIEVDSRSLDSSGAYDCVRVNVASGSGTTVLGILYILSEPRYAQANPPAAISE